MTAPGPARRLRIERLELDLRGVPPATAEAAARALGPALARALGQSLATAPLQQAPADRIDAGRLAMPGSPGPLELATGIAQRIADSARRSSS